MKRVRFHPDVHMRTYPAVHPALKPFLYFTGEELDWIKRDFISQKQFFLRLRRQQQQQLQQQQQQQQHRQEREEHQEDSPTISKSAGEVLPHKSSVSLMTGNVKPFHASHNDAAAKNKSPTVSMESAVPGQSKRVLTTMAMTDVSGTILKPVNKRRRTISAGTPSSASAATPLPATVRTTAMLVPANRQQ